MTKIQNSKRVWNFEFQISNLFRISNFEFRVSRTGFTLVEVVVYVAILAVISLFSVNTILVIHASLGEIRLTRALTATAAVAMERTVRTIRDASAVDTVASTFDSSPGILVLTGAEVPPLTYRLQLNQASLELDAGGTTSRLTPPGLHVTNLVFRMIRASTTSEAIKIELTLAASSGKATTTQNLYGTAVLRNSYSP